MFERGSNTGALSGEIKMILGSIFLATLVFQAVRIAWNLENLQLLVELIFVVTVNK